MSVFAFKTLKFTFRYSDFHVNEIDLDGNVVKLTTLEIPENTEEEGKLVIQICFEESAIPYSS